MIDQITKLSIQSGDLVWVQLSEDATPEEVREFQNDILDQVPEDVLLVVTTDDLVRSIQALSVQGLVQLRAKIDLLLDISARNSNVEGSGE